MANTNVYISEFQGVAQDAAGGGGITIPSGLNVDQVVAITSVAANSAAFQPSTRIIEIEAGSACSVLLGPASTALTTATANNMRMNAGDRILRGIPAAQGWGLSVISNT